MGWSAANAINAYLDTFKSCNKNKSKCDSIWKTQEPGSNEFVSALAAGMKAKLIVEVASTVSTSTIALAVAAKQTGGKLVCILPEQAVSESKRVIKELGFEDIVEFKTGEASEVLTNYQNIDFILVDCNKNDDYIKLLNVLDVNPNKSVVVANNLDGKRAGLGGHFKGMNDAIVYVRSTKHPIGKGMEVTMIGKSNEMQMKDYGGGRMSPRLGKKRVSLKKAGKTKWLIKVDERSGEEHIYRVSK